MQYAILVGVPLLHTFNLGTDTRTHKLSLSHTHAHTQTDTDTHPHAHVCTRSLVFFSFSFVFSLSLSPSLSPHPRVHVRACGRVPRFFLLIIGVRGVPVLDAFRKTFRNLQPRFASSKPMVLGPYTVLLLYADSQLCVYSMTSW